MFSITSHLDLCFSKNAKTCDLIFRNIAVFMNFMLFFLIFSIKFDDFGWCHVAGEITILGFWKFQAVWAYFRRVVYCSFIFSKNPRIIQILVCNFLNTFMWLKMRQYLHENIAFKKSFQPKYLTFMKITVKSKKLKFIISVNF